MKKNNKKSTNKILFHKIHRKYLSSIQFKFSRVNQGNLTKFPNRFAYWSKQFRKDKIKCRNLLKIRNTSS